MINYVKPKSAEKAKLCYMNTDCFIVHVKTENIYKDITENTKNRFDISNYKVHWPLLNRKNKDKLLV